MKGYNELAAIIHENAVAHGWWDTERSFAEVVALIHSELSEALEEYRNEMPMMYVATGDVSKVREGKPEGIVVELADAIIRILDYCGYSGIDIEMALEERKAGFNTYTLPELVAECHYLLSKAYKNIEARSLYLAECISNIAFWIKENGGDIEEAIVLKHEYNKSRPYRHGGKKC